MVFKMDGKIKNESIDASETLVVSSINRAIREMSKGGVVVLIVPGEVIFSYDIPTYNYNSDEHLHPWLKAALEEHVILLKCDDVKLQKVVEISRQCHFELFTVLDFPEQEVSGSAYSIVSSLPRILHSELEMFGKVKEATTVVQNTSAKETDVAKVDDANASSAQSTPSGRFANVVRKLNG